MSGVSNPIELILVVGIWLLWYGSAIAKEISKNRRAEREPVQLLITDVWAAMPGWVFIFYVTFARYVGRGTELQISEDLQFRLPIAGLFVASQCAGLFLFFLQLSRFKESRRQSRRFRALAVFLGSILNIVTCALVISFAYSILNGSFFCSTILMLILIWIFKGLKED